MDDSEIHPIGKFLRLDYSNATYKREAIESTPNYTPSRVKIFETNKILAVDNVSNDTMIANTVTTKQDRNPNSGLIEYRDINLVNGAKYRNLTPRECFLLMGFNEQSYDLLLENNSLITKSRSILSPSKLYKLAGNSIVVPILEEIFKQIDTIDKKFLNCEKIGV
ncbi:DNA cytosine methyltransferase [Trichococcus ilyis]|uniref:DNA cytosine methyltransferase n=1 Tax=Trichococcus ilyis TaxID=640938 RepID=UPI0008380013|nr:DNA cytosine methyltransferase [Trichococcus ilyis]